MTLFDAPTRSEPRHWRRASNEAFVADFVPISAPVTEFASITREGDYMISSKLEGISFEAASPGDLLAAHEDWCSAVSSLPAGEFALYCHRIQHRITDRLTDPEEPAFSAAFSKFYQDRVTAKPLLTKALYLTLVYRPFASWTDKRLALSNATRQNVAERQAAALATLDEKVTTLERILREFEPRRLGAREEGGSTYWEAGELYSFLINGRWTSVPWPVGPAYYCLPEARLFFAGDRLELRHLDAHRFACALEIKEYAHQVQPGSLGDLLYEPFEFVETQSFRSLARRKAIAALQVQRNQLIASEDVVAEQIVQMDEAINDLGDGKFQMGEYHYSLVVFGDTPLQASDNAAKAAGAVKQGGNGLELVRCDLVSDAAWFAQVPGNFRWRTREAVLSSRAFAALACQHNFRRGKRDGNPWGEALMIFRTPAGEIVHFSPHPSPPKQDNEGQKLPGSVVTVATTGGGKTTLLGAMFALMPKWKPTPRLISFSLRRDTEILVRALRGRFIRFEHNRPTGINPLQREATPANVAHWKALVVKCLLADGLPLLPTERDAIAQAVDTVARMEESVRFFSTLRQSLSREKGPIGISLWDRFGRWCRAGEYGWVFDSATDQLRDIDAYRAIGFDYTDILDNEDIKTPIMMELIHVMRGLLDGKPLVYHVAEAWKALSDPEVFGPFINHEQRTIRAQGGIGVLDTQELADFLSNDNGRAAFAQAATTLWLPNKRAQRDVFTGPGGLTDAEFDTVTSLGRAGTRQILCKQGHESFLCEFDLAGADDFLTVLSGNRENVELLDDIRAEVGDDPDVWLPILYRRAAQSRAPRTISLPRRVA